MTSGSADTPRADQANLDEEAEAALASAGAAAGPPAGEEVPEAPHGPSGGGREGVAEHGPEVQDVVGAPPPGLAFETVEAESVPAEELVQDDLEELRAKAARSEEYLGLAQRTQADFDNFRKRMQREVAGAEARGIGKLARELLPAIDNLERALDATDSPGPEHELAEGIRLVQAELAAALGRIGIEGYSPQGKPFDPAVHEAMAQLPVEGATSGTVVEVLQRGYRLHDTVLRPARVVVAA
ncbi:MAG TPA: nucleotide exchange factor GrpE [Solirubrobacteraceae bacterium]|nr:nucleotide exchange factor GrpE [Solirubrobacteraceae bacterium]